MDNKNLLPSIILGIGFVLGCYLLGTKFVQSKFGNRFVTVKGLAERKVIADQAWWGLNAQLGADDVSSMQAQIPRVERIVKDFLMSEGFVENEIKIDGVNVYPNNYEGAASRFSGQLSVNVTTTNIAKVQQASAHVTKLIEQGVFLNIDKWSSGPKYYFTQFKEIKPEMLAEATKQAKLSAQEFAKNSGANVGSIKRANQGIFQILPSNQTNEDEVFYADKIIRVVSTFDYYLN